MPGLAFGSTPGWFKAIFRVVVAPFIWNIKDNTRVFGQVISIKANSYLSVYHRACSAAVAPNHGVAGLNNLSDGHLSSFHGE